MAVYCQLTITRHKFWTHIISPFHITRWRIIFVAADVCETAGNNREQAVQALLSMDSPSTESRTFLNTVPNGNTSTTQQSKTGNLIIQQPLVDYISRVMVLPMVEALSSG